MLSAEENPQALLRAMFDAAVASADPRRVLARHLPSPPTAASGGKTYVLGAGKAAAAMAQAVVAAWSPPVAPPVGTQPVGNPPVETPLVGSPLVGPLVGLVVTRYGHAVPCAPIEVVEAAHPVPDAAGLRAAERILACATAAEEGDLVLVLISGGGSALLSLPGAGVGMADKQHLNKALLAAGATIAEMNCVRKHISAIKGGRLARAAWPARCITLVISDVPGDDPAVIASGPTVADPTTRADASAVLSRYGVAVPDAVAQWLASPDSESVKPDDACFGDVGDVRMIATPQQALEAAQAVATAAQLPAHILGDAIEGDARSVAQMHAGIALQIARRDQPFAAPCVLLSGGETTVAVRGAGRGGRNVEFLLALAIALDGAAGVHALAGDTDGVDGVEEVAGAVLTPDTLTRARALGLDPQRYLDANDAHSFFQALGDQVVTGATLTNVNDFRAIIIA